MSMSPTVSLHSTLRCRKPAQIFLSSSTHISKATCSLPLPIQQSLQTQYHHFTIYHVYPFQNYLYQRCQTTFKKVDNTMAKPWGSLVSPPEFILAKPLTSCVSEQVNLSERQSPFLKKIKQPQYHSHRIIVAMNQGNIWNAPNTKQNPPQAFNKY